MRALGKDICITCTGSTDHPCSKITCTIEPLSDQRSVHQPYQHTHFGMLGTMWKLVSCSSHFPSSDKLRVNLGQCFALGVHEPNLTPPNRSNFSVLHHCHCFHHVSHLRKHHADSLHRHLAVATSIFTLVLTHAQLWHDLQLLQETLLCSHQGCGVGTRNL